jgi:hypothetical protein
MSKIDTSITTRDRSNSDLAVDGLLNGLLGGVAMAAFLVVVTLLNGWEFESIFELLVESSPSPITSVAVHFAISGVYGIGFGLFYGMALTRVKGSPTVWLLLFSGLVYGALIWLLAVTVIIPQTDGFFATLPSGYLISAHFLYGMITGLLFKRNGSDRLS